MAKPPEGTSAPQSWRSLMCVPGCQESVRNALTRRGFFQGAAATTFAAVSVEPAGAAPRKFKSVVDLTHALSADFPTFDGGPGIELQKRYEFAKDGYNLNWWRIS